MEKKNEKEIVFISGVISSCLSSIPFSLHKSYILHKAQWGKEKVPSYRRTRRIILAHCPRFEQIQESLFVSVGNSRSGKADVRIHQLEKDAESIHGRLSSSSRKEVSA